MNANYRGMSQYPEEYSGYGQSGTNMQAVGFHQGSYDSANMAMMNPMGGSGGGGGSGSGTYPLSGYDSGQSHMMMASQGQQQMAAHQQAMYQHSQQQQQAAAYLAQQQQQQQYYSGSGSGGNSGGQYAGQTYPVQGAAAAAANIPAAMGGGGSPYYNAAAGGQSQGGGGGGTRMVPPPHHHLRNTSGQQNPQQVADNILQMASAFPSHHTVQVPLKNRHAPYQIPRSPQNYYPEKCGGQQQGMGSQGPQQVMHNPQAMMGQPAVVGGGQLQTKSSQPQVQMGQSPNVSQSPAMMYAGSSPHSQMQHSSPSSPLMMQSPPTAQAHQSLSSPGALNSPSSAAVCSPVPSSPGLANMRSPSSMPMRSPAHLSSGYPNQPISSPPQRPFAASDCSGGAQHCSPTSMHSPASHTSSPYASAGMAHLVNSPPQQSQSYSAPNQSSCKMNMLMDSGQGPGGQRVQSMHGQGSDPLQSLQKLVMLPETQVVDPKSVVNDGCLQNCEDGSKNCEGPAEQSREAMDCSAGVSVNSSPPTADAHSTSNSPPQDVSAESAPVSQELVSQSDCTANPGDSTEAPSVTQNLPSSSNENACERHVSPSPSKFQSSLSSESSDQTVCSTSPQIKSSCKSDTLSDTANTGKPQSESCQSETVVSTTVSEKPQPDVENVVQKDGSSTNGLKKQNVVSSPVCNGPAKQMDSSDKIEEKQLSNKSSIPGASVESDSQKVVAEVASDIVRETEKEVQCNTLKEDCNTNTTEAALKPSPPKKRHSQRLLTLATRSYKSLNEGNLAYFDLDSRFGLDKKGVQSSNTVKPSPPKKRHSRRLSPSSGSKSASDKVNAKKSTGLKDEEGSNSVIPEEVLHRSDTASKQKLVNGFDDRHASPTGDVVIGERPDPQNHIHKQQTDRCSETHDSSVKDVVVTKGKAESIVQSNVSRAAGIVNGPKDMGLVTSSKKTEVGNSTELAGQRQGSISVSDSSSVPTANVFDSVISHHSVSGDEEDSFSSELDFGYDSPPFEMQDDSWKPELEKGAPTSDEDEADGNGDNAVNDSVQRPNQSSKGVGQSSPSKPAPLMVTRSVTRSITGHIPPKRRTEEIEYITNYKRTRRSSVISGHHSLSLSMECDEIDTKESSSDVEVISSDDESLRVHNTECKSHPSVYIPVSNDKNKRTPVVLHNKSSKKRNRKGDAKNQNIRGQSKNCKPTPNFYSVRGIGGRFISRREASLSPSSVTSPGKTDFSSQLFNVAEQQFTKEKEGDNCTVSVKETRRHRNRSEQHSVTVVSCGVTSTLSKLNHSNVDTPVKVPQTTSHPRPNSWKQTSSEHHECLADKNASSKMGGTKQLECLTDRKDSSKNTEDRSPPEYLPGRKGAVKKDEVRTPHECLPDKKGMSKSSEDRPALERFYDRKVALKMDEVRQSEDSLFNRESTSKKNESRPPHEHLPDRKDALKMDEVRPPHEHLPDKNFASENNDIRPLCLPDRKGALRKEEVRPACFSDKKSASRKDEARSVTKQKKSKKRGNQNKNRFSELETVDDSFKIMKFSKTLDHLHHNKKDKSQPGKVFSPFVRVQGKRSTPSVVSVFNTPPVDGKNSKSTNKMKGATGAATAATTTTVQITNFSSDKSVMVPWAKTIEAPWVCGLCGKRSSYRFLGDLFGPYFLESQISSLSKGAAESGKKDRHDNATAGPPDVQNPHNTRRKSLTQNRSLSTEETTAPPPPQEVWVHEDCVLWSTGVCVVGSRIHGLEEALSASAGTICACCQEKGALIGCLHKGCNQNFHYICAVDKMCFLDVENFSMLCPKHKDKRMKSATASTSKS